MASGNNTSNASNSEAPITLEARAAITRILGNTSDRVENAHY